MTDISIGIDIEDLRVRKKKELFLEVDQLLHEYRNVVHTSQISTKSLNEQLKNVSRRFKNHHLNITDVEERVSSEVTQCQTELMENLSRELQALRDMNDQFIRSRTSDSEARMIEIKSALRNENRTDVDAIDPGSNELIPKKQVISRVLDEYCSSEPGEAGGESHTKPVACDISGYQALRETINSSNSDLERLQHSVYEITTSIDECSMDHTALGLTRDKSNVLKELRHLRSDMHSKTHMNEIRLRGLSSRAADCRCRLRDAAVSLSKLHSLIDCYNRLSHSF